MKRILTEAVTFVPAAKTLDFSNVDNFNFKSLVSVTNQTTGTIIYAPAMGVGFSGTISGNIVTLNYNTVSMSALDILQIQYDL